MIYLIGILFILHEDLANFIYPIVFFYGITLLGASFLSTILWEEEKNKTNLNLMIGAFMLTLSGSLLDI
jgi:Na+-translocating ferredoxin:NAD+ oxidoreductase RnfD subunit